MNPTEEYIAARDKQVRQNIAELNNPNYGYDDRQTNAGRIADFTEYLVKTNYTKNFTWAGIPIIQYATDLMVMQEIIWQVRPEWIIECGLAFGGMTAFYATMLDFMGHGYVLGIDIDIREHTRKALLHPRIALKQSSSIDEGLIKTVRELVQGTTVLVALDSCHSHIHVLKELELYAPLVSVGSYIVVFDTAIEFYHHLDKAQDRPWGNGNSPYTAVQAFLKTEMGQNFVVDREVEMRALITAAPGGFLQRIK